MQAEKKDVVIVGAGLAGLSAAVFLALNGIRPLVVDRNPSTSVLPKARGQNPITMEAMRVAGVSDAIYAACPPGVPGITSKVSECMTGKVLFDHVANRPDFARFSPEVPGLASQARAETALLQRARQLGVEIRFDCDCLALIEKAEHVELRLRSEPKGPETTIAAQYVVAADGIRGTIAQQLGIGSHGLGHLKSVTAVRFNADLSRWSGNNAMTIHYVKNARLPDGSGILVSTDHPGQWVANFSADPQRPLASTEALIRVLVGVPDLAFEITGDTTYNYSHRIADRMCTARVFLAGDAAHVMPPTGGQGGNTAMQDGYYLGWKLASVLRRHAGAKLLQSYDAERRPYAEIVCTWQAANLAERRDMKGLAQRTGGPIDHATMMFGYVCPDGAFVRAADDWAPPSSHPFEDPSHPTGTPGARLPYARLRAGGREIVTRRELDQQFQIYTDDERLALDAQEVARALQVPQTVHLVDSVAALQLRPGAAMLVRPDGIVGWRGTARDALDHAYRHILDRAQEKHP
jgi:2-polyprenyl-6-methoxyphenol hydroxylase-like FAD-dependent oxidoreductase